VGDRFLFDCGSSTYATASPDAGGLYWNNPNFVATTTGVNQGTDDAVTTTNVVTGVELWQHHFWSTNTSGSLSSALYPETAQRDSWVAYSEAGVTPLWVGHVILKNLPGSAYDVTLFGSRSTGSNNRLARFTIDGVDQVLDCQANTDKVVTFKGIAPVNGEIDVTVQSHLEAGYAYLGVVDLLEVPEPATLSLLVLGGLAMLRRRR
jgi:hypothetical protein